MNIKTMMTWPAAVAVAAAGPGGLDPSFAPELRATAASAAIVAPDGKLWVSGGFDEAGGVPVGDWLVLGPDGGVEREGVPGYLNGWPSAFAVSFNGTSPAGIPLYAPPDLFPLSGGACLIPNGSGGWLRVNPAGVVVENAFPDQAAGEFVAPQFERDGKLFVIRTFGDGRVALEMRNSGDGSVDPSFAQAEDIPVDPVAAVAGPDGKLWVIGSSPGTVPASLLIWPPGGVDHSLFRMDGSGAMDAGFAPKRLPSFRSHSLATGPEGAVRIVMGPDSSRWNYWPAPETSVYRLEFYGAAGNLQRRQDFSIPLGTRFVWAEDGEGKVVATGADGRLVAWVEAIDSSDHFVDPSFASPGRVSSVKALPDGKWLVDGHRRLLPDGTDDPTWTDPRLDRPAENRAMHPMPGRGMLVSGNFATVQAGARPWMAVLREDGTADDHFTLDPRVGEVKSAAVQGDAVFAVTSWPVDYGSGIMSNLVKLNADGSLDEAFSPNLGFFSPTNSPAVSPATGAVLSFIAWNQFTSVHAAIDGKILAETVSNGGDVRTRSLHRLNANGSRDGAFAAWTSYNQWGDILALKNGKTWIGGELLDEDGGVIRDLTAPGVYLRPLCEWQGGVLFLESRDGFKGRLKLWKGSSWVCGFAAPGVGMASLIATPGESGLLYLQASFGGSRVMLRRLKPDGRIDTTFRAPLFEYRQRREGEWWTTGDSGREDYAPSPDQSASAISAMRWDRDSRRLWVAGGFNQVDGKPRDGIARILGGTEGRAGR